MTKLKSVAIIFTRSKEGAGQGLALQRPMLPNPLLYLGSYLKKKGVNVYLIDEQVEDVLVEIEKIIDKVDFLCFSVMTMQVSGSYNLSRYLKSRYPSKKIVWGGIHPSLLPEQTISDPNIDYVCQREGEKCLFDLVSGKPLNRIKNLVYKKDGKVVINPLDDFLDLDELSPPDWGLLNIEKYIYDYHLGGVSAGRTLPITVGRGCIFNCTFCVNTILGKKWRSMSLKKIMNEIEILKKKYRIQHVTINDDCFNVNMARLKEFCNLMIQKNLGLTWDCSARAGQYWTDEMMSLMKKAGCIAISIGAESGSDRVLKEVIKKGVTTKDLIYTAKQCNKFGISLISSWMSGLPTETNKELKQTLKLIKQVTTVCPSCSIHGPQPFKPYPGSELYFWALKGGLNEPRTLAEWVSESDDGFLKKNRLPWIKNPERLEHIEFFVMNAFRDPKNLLHRFLIWDARLRLSLNFFALPFEIPLTAYMLKVVKLR